MNAICIIPARGGSKRIPRKNIKEFCGKPMIAWSVEAAIKSECFDRIVVSTDDDEIASVAREWGAEVPFMRPAELADDHTPTRPVVTHAIEEMSRLYGTPEAVCTIYSTAIFLRPEDIRRARERLINENRDFAFSVATFPYPIQRALRMTQSGGVEMFYPEHRLTRSQDLEEAYHDAGQFYWGRTEAFLSNKPTFSPTSAAVVLPRHRVQDLDTQEDWEHATLLFRVLEQQDR